MRRPGLLIRRSPGSSPECVTATYARNILVQRNVAGSKAAKALSDMRPQATAGSFPDSGATAGGADVLAGEPGGDQVHRGNGGPVDPGQVAHVGDAGEPGGQDRAGIPVAVGAPGQGDVQHGHHGQIQAAVAGAQARGPQPPASRPRAGTRQGALTRPGFRARQRPAGPGAGKARQARRERVRQLLSSIFLPVGPGRRTCMFWFVAPDFAC